MKLKAHNVVIVHDGHEPGNNGIALGRTCFLDGRELLMPAPSIVKVEIGNDQVMTATFTVIADVEFRDPPPPPRRGVLVRIWGRLFPVKR